MFSGKETKKIKTQLIIRNFLLSILEINLHGDEIRISQRLANVCKKYADEI